MTMLPRATRVLPPPTAGMQSAQRPTGIIMALIVAVIAMLLTGVLPLIVMVTKGVQIGLAGGSFVTSELLSGRDFMALSIFSFVFGAGLIFLWVRAKEKRSIGTLGFQAPAGYTPARVAALRGAALGLGMMTVCVLIPVLFGQAELNWRVPELTATAWGFIALMLLGFLLQGSTEEIVTRGFLTQAVARKWGLTLAIIIQAIFFAAFHGGNPGMGALPFINLVLFALFGSMLSLADGSLWGICMFHGIWNWAQGNFFGVAVSGNALADSVFAYTPLSGSSDLITGGAFGIEGSLITTLLYLVGAVIAWRVYRRRAPLTSTANARSEMTEPAN